MLMAVNVGSGRCWCTDGHDGCQFAHTVHSFGRSMSTMHRAHFPVYQQCEKWYAPAIHCIHALRYVHCCTGWSAHDGSIADQPLRGRSVLACGHLRRASIKHVHCLQLSRRMIAAVLVSLTSILYLAVPVNNAADSSLKRIFCCCCRMCSLPTTIQEDQQLLQSINMQHAPRLQAAVSARLEHKELLSTAQAVLQQYAASVTAMTS